MCHVVSINAYKEGTYIDYCSIIADTWISRCVACSSFLFDPDLSFELPTTKCCASLWLLSTPGLLHSVEAGTPD